MNAADWQDFAAALADDAESLAALHDRELDAATLAALKAVDFPANLGLLPESAAARDAWQLMTTALGALPAAPAAGQLDDLAADFAAIHLTGAHGASPCESVWLDDDGLICQAPMFALREIYAQAGLASSDWRRRPDDHLVLQLLYIAHALRGIAEEAADDAANQAADDIANEAANDLANAGPWRSLATMLDEHLLRWLPHFAARVAARADQPFYAGLSLLTAAWCEGLRELLAERLGEPRPSVEQVAERLRKPKAAATAPLVFMPGVGPGW